MIRDLPGDRHLVDCGQEHRMRITKEPSLISQVHLFSES